MTRFLHRILPVAVVVGLLGWTGHDAAAVVLAVVGTTMAIAAATAPRVDRALASALGAIGHAVGRVLTFVLLGIVSVFLLLPVAALAAVGARHPREGVRAAGGWREHPRRTQGLARRTYARESAAIPARSGLHLAVEALGWVTVVILLDLVAGWVWSHALTPYDAAAQALVPSAGAQSVDTSERADTPAMQGVPWAPAYFAELDSLEYEFVPFIGGAAKDHHGRFIDITDGVRQSYETADLPSDAPTVWFFGGSTTWGEGQRDGHTMPSEVARLAESAGTPIRVVNYGERGFVLWQELLRFEQALAVEDPPDLVVFYDGLNELQVQLDQDVPGQPTVYNADTYDVRLNSPTPLMGTDGEPIESVSEAAWLWWREHSALSRLVERVQAEFAVLPAAADDDVGWTPEEEMDAVPAAVDVYVRGRDLLLDLAERHDVPTLLTWQPDRYSVENDGTADEAAAARVGPPTIDLTGALDDVDPDRVFIDGGTPTSSGRASSRRRSGPASATSWSRPTAEHGTAPRPGADATMTGMRSTTVVPVLLLAVALVTGACSSADDDASSDTVVARVEGAAFGADDLPPLRLQGGDDPRIVDADGRQVLLRGVNLNTLAEYGQADPDLDPTFPHDAADFAEMATLGFDVVRLLLSWSRLEPEPGRIDQEYLDQVHATVDDAADQGLYTVLDVHQDAYSAFVGSPEGTTCPDGQSPGLDWDGAPEWATLTDGASTCASDTGGRESAGAVVAAWDNFWANTDGIQDHLVDVWERLGEEFGADPAVAGYDLLNEPGFGPGVDGTNVALGEFYGRAIEAVRRGEATAGADAPHLVFVEPVILWSGLGDAPVPTDFTDDPDVVFSPHLYAESISAPTVTIAEGFDNAAAKAAVLGTTFWVGEYGWFGDPDEQAGLVQEYARQEDRHLVGGAWWQWRQACGDPHSVNDPDREPPDVLVHLHRTSCPDGEDLGLTQPWATTLSRTYPRAAPGLLTRLRNDAASGAARIRGEVDGDGTLVLWVPDRDLGVPLVSSSTGDTGTITAGAGGYRVEVPVSGSYEVRVTPTDALSVGGGAGG